MQAIAETMPLETAECRGPLQFAQRLATYISDPSRIRSLTVREYGEKRAPSLKRCANLRELYLQRRAAFEAVPKGRNCEAANDDGEAFRVRGLLHERRRALIPSEAKPVQLRPTLIPFRPLGQRIIEAVAGEFDLTVEQLCSPARARLFVVARSVAIRLLRDCTWGSGEPRFSMPQIAKLVGRRDHTTVIHNLRMFPRWMKQYPEAADVYDRLQELADG